MGEVNFYFKGGGGLDSHINNINTQVTRTEITSSSIL